MKKALVASLFMTFLVGRSMAADEVLWYGGDAVLSAYINNSATSYRVLDDFVVDDAAGWHVTGLFSNNVADNVDDISPLTHAIWSIRTGVGPDDLGTIHYSGLDPALVIPTGRVFEPFYVEYMVAVSGISIDLTPGVYFMSVSPVDAVNFDPYYVGDTDGTNAIGMPGPHNVFHQVGDQEVWEYETNRVSMGVIGSRVVPEPSAALLLLLAAIYVAVRAGNQHA